MTTVREVNAALKARGIKERLRRGSGSGYFYFFGGAAHTWPRTAIYTVSLAGLSVEDVLAERSTMSRTRSIPTQLTKAEPQPPRFQKFSRAELTQKIFMCETGASASRARGHARLCRFKRLT